MGTVQQLKSYLKPSNVHNKHAKYAYKVLMERLKPAGFTRRRLPSQVTMARVSGMAESIERGQIDRFTVQQLRSYLKPSNVHNKHAKYAYKVLMERLKPAGFTRRRMGANDEKLNDDRDFGSPCCEGTEEKYDYGLGPDVQASQVTMIRRSGAAERIERTLINN